MYVVSKLNVDINTVEIVYIELDEDDDAAALSALNELMCDIENLKKSEDIENQKVIVNSNRIEIFQRGYITGKTLKYVYEIIKYEN